MWPVEKGRFVGYRLKGRLRCVRAAVGGPNSGLVKLVGDGEGEK